MDYALLLRREPKDWGKTAPRELRRFLRHLEKKHPAGAQGWYRSIFLRVLAVGVEMGLWRPGVLQVASRIVWPPKALLRQGFVYLPKLDKIRCPAGNLSHGKAIVGYPQKATHYTFKTEDCRECPLAFKCLTETERTDKTAGYRKRVYLSLRRQEALRQVGEE